MKTLSMKKSREREIVWLDLELGEEVAVSATMKGREEELVNE